MSHELRTPLNAIIGFSGFIMMANKTEITKNKIVEYAGDIHDSGVHLLNVINELLDLSKVEAGKLDLEERIVDVDALVHSCVAMVRERAQDASLILELDTPEIPPLLIADELKLKQAVLNLLSNAVKFTQKGGRVTVRTFIDETGAFIIQVADDGIGIAADDMARVMRPFDQGQNVLTKEHGGTGLGLPLTKALIELHDGTFVLDSRVGVGTEATISLPPTRTIPDNEANLKISA
jgi:signal transduction histidine kinase